ncbi:MAG: glutaredoxin 3 [Alphaproteobacteria bacterium]|nr:glutaredoxin 3 [Alphaproteobacteria bacterium]
MARVIVYSGPACPYCDRAKMLLKKKGAAFEDFNVKADADKLAEMMQKSGGRRTIPQIFIGDRHIGGYDDLVALDAAGKLDPLLAE